MRLLQSTLAGLVCSALASASSATVLTFDTGEGSPSPVPITYGNRVGDPSTFQPAQFHYGAACGITPNVNVIYSPVLRMGGTANPFDPTHVFGDLTNVIYRDRDGGLEPGILQVSFVADPGFQVCLHAFDLATSFNSLTGQGEILTAKSIKVFGQGGLLLFDLEYNSTDVSPSSPTSTAIPYIGHRSFDFDPAPLCDQSITIRLDLNNYTTIGGSKVDRFAIDNIKISQTVVMPTPGASALLAVAVCIAGLRGRRRPGAMVD